MQAKNVKGCTGVSESAAWGAPFTGPVQGTGAHTGTVKSFGPKGYGFINMEDGKEMFFNVKDCVGSKPISGDTVRFDVVDSDTKPGQLKAWGLKVEARCVLILMCFAIKCWRIPLKVVTMLRIPTRTLCMQSKYKLAITCPTLIFKQAANITGGSQPLDSPHPGTKPSWGPWGGMGPMGGMGGMGGMGPMGGAMAAMGGKGWGWDGGKGAMSAMWNWGGKGWGGDGWSKGMGKGYGPAAAAPVAPGPYSAGGCAKGGW